MFKSESEQVEFYLKKFNIELPAVESDGDDDINERARELELSDDFINDEELLSIGGLE